MRLNPQCKLPHRLCHHHRQRKTPPPTGEDQSVQVATAMIGESGFQLMPAKLPFTPSGPPYIDNPGGGPMPANGVLEPNNMDPSSDNGDTGNPSSRPSPARTTTTEGGDPVPPKGPSSPALSGAQCLNNAGEILAVSPQNQIINWSWQKCEPS